MKTKNINPKAANDVLIEDLPKADTINNSDLFVLQKLNGETEATSIQELTRKIQDGGTSYGEDLGQILFFTSRTQNPNMHAMDGTIGTKAEYPEFYNFLLTLTEIEKQFWALNETDETFFFKSLNNKFLKITGGSITTEGSSSSYVVDHTHQVLGSYLDNFWLNPQTGTKPSGAKRVLVERVTGDAVQKTSVALGTGTSTTPISSNIAPSVLLYAYVVTKNLNRASSSLYIKSDGTVAMNNDYTPTDPLDVATKKYIDNKFLNYEIPLSFSINDIGKRVPYYKNAENNPTLIALDGTKYLITDYPDFDYTQTGFTNDGVYFWFKNIELEIKSFQNEIQPSNEWFKIPYYAERPRGETLEGNFEFESKMIYNFLQSPQGAPYLFANPNDNAGFTILDPITYKIRANYNNWARFTEIPSDVNIFKFKIQKADINGSFRFPLLGGEYTFEGVSYYLGATGEVSYLKIQPDYMVAKIQQVGSVAGTGDLLADRSVLLTGAGTFNTKQVVSMDDLKSENIIVGGNARALITLDTKLVEVDTNISTINSNIGSVDISGLQNQVNTNTSDIDSIKTVNTNQDNTIASLQSQVNSLQAKLNSYDTKYRNFTEKRLKSGLSVTVSSNATNLTNLTQYFTNSQTPTITSFGSSISGLPLGAIGLTEVGSGVNQGFKFPTINGIVNCNLTFSTRITGTITGNAGTPRELIVYVRRVSDNSIVANGALIKINDNNFNARNVITPSFIQGANDSFLNGGFYLNMLNNSGGTLTINTIELLIQGY